AILFRPHVQLRGQFRLLPDSLFRQMFVTFTCNTIYSYLFYFLNNILYLKTIIVELKLQSIKLVLNLLSSRTAILQNIVNKLFCLWQLSLCLYDHADLTNNNWLIKLCLCRLMLLSYNIT